jgi:dienelactone hydrolase
MKEQRMRSTVLSLTLGLAFGCALLAPRDSRADEAAPRLVPGQVLSFQFPEMPPTLFSVLVHTNVPATMTVYLPRNYDPQRKHPLLIFLGGGNGGKGQSAAVARKLSEEQDFVCVDLPLFKEKVEPASATNATPPMLIRAADGKFMWPLYRTMLAKLEATVPNLDPARRVLGGFSNGAHTTAALIDQSDGEVARRFSAFFFAEGGGRLERYDLLKGKPLLMLYGSAKSQKRLQEIYQTAVAAGAQATLHEMKDVGHAFPEAQYPAVRAWLRGAVLP